MEIKKCCICGNEIIGLGNNPYPIAKEGECCDACNLQKVIPERIFIMNTANKIHNKVINEIVETDTNEGKESEE